MAGKKWRSKEKTLLDDKEIADLRLVGTSQADIGKQVGLSTATVHRVLKRLMKKWSEEALESTNQMVGFVIQSSLKLMYENWQAYLRSVGEVRKEVRKVRRQAGVPDEQAAGEVTVFTETQAGDPRYLSNMANLLQQIRDLLGLDQPMKTRNEIVGELDTVQKLIVEYEKPEWMTSEYDEDLNIDSNGKSAEAGRNGR
jgi:DNA-binding MarR family transcriptional regulator